MRWGAGNALGKCRNSRFRAPDFRFRVVLFHQGIDLIDTRLGYIDQHEELSGLEAGFKYAMVGAAASAFLLIGIAFLYKLTGTLNIDDMAGKLPLEIVTDEKWRVTIKGDPEEYTHPEYLEDERPDADAEAASSIRVGDLAITVATDPSLPTRMVIGQIVRSSRPRRRPGTRRCRAPPARRTGRSEDNEAPAIDRHDSTTRSASGSLLTSCSSAAKSASLISPSSRARVNSSMRSRSSSCRMHVREKRRCRLARPY